MYRIIVRLDRKQTLFSQGSSNEKPTIELENFRKREN